jgi:hypothetical protein
LAAVSTMEIKTLRTVIGSFLVLASIGTAAFVAAFQQSILEVSVYVFTGPGALLRIIAIVLLLLNLKSLPLAWHVGPDLFV